MNILDNFKAIFQQEHRSVAKITGISATGYIAETTSGKQPVALVGSGYSVGQTVFYDAHTRQILETAPDLVVVDLMI